MKKNVLFDKVTWMGGKFLALGLLACLPLSAVAQDDDMYFVPSKENVDKEARTYGLPSKTYYSGSNRSVDDYNRKAWSVVTPVDSAGNDIIEFSAVKGVYPDSAYIEESDNNYQLTRRMSRFDDYSPAEIYWEGYRDGSWASPWYYPSRYIWYDPWYWNDPWYGSYYYGYYGYYRPWYGSYWGYHRPWYGGYYGYYNYYGPRHYGRVRHVTTPRSHASWNTATGSRTYSHGNSVHYNGGTFGGSGVTRYPSRSTSVTRGSSTTTSSGTRLGNFGGARSGGSFGGSRSSGGSSGGGRFGGRR